MGAFGTLETVPVVSLFEVAVLGEIKKTALVEIKFAFLNSNGWNFFSSFFII